MKKISRLLIAVFAFFLISSCGSDDEPSNQETLVGEWSGTLVQPEFGELKTVFSISSVNGNMGTGSGSFTSGDLSNCDNTQFVCTALFCNFSLDMVSSSGSFFVFDQAISGTNNTCGDGIFEITVVNSSTINVTWYEEPYPDNRATGTLTKK